MLRDLARVALVATIALASAPVAEAQSRASVDQFIAPGFPQDLVSAKKADRIAWLVYERGMRNVYTATGPDFRPVRLTKFLDDNGIVLTDLSISDDGALVAFVRGSEPNREGWIANPSSDARGPDRGIWAARTDGGGAWRLAEGGSPSLSPDGHTVVFSRDGQLYRAQTAQSARVPVGKPGGELIVRAWGKNDNAVWSPDGAKVAFVSARDNHSLAAVYDLKSRAITYLAPSIDFDLSPTWSPDSKRIAFIRRPGTPFG
ncbi:MAG: S9 family peptidase, partial [Gemmatimonadota bacterium]|nr:S9 family peptidase [Gemmatimonadota bacterium]